MEKQLEIQENRINELSGQIYNLTQKMVLDYIKKYLTPLNKRVENDLNTIEKIYLKNNEDLLRNRRELKLLYMFGIGKRSVEKRLFLEKKVLIQELELQEFNEKFSHFDDELKNRIINIFNVFVRIIIENGKTDDVKYVYALYQTLLISTLNMLPETYRNQVLETPAFSEVKQNVKILNYEDDFYFSDIKLYFEYIFEKYIIEFIEKEYGIQFFTLAEENENPRKGRK